VTEFYHKCAVRQPVCWSSNRRYF